MNRETVLRRWPRLASLDQEPPVAEVVRERDEATARALDAYLAASQTVASKPIIRL
jgi:hypothetical protein